MTAPARHDARTRRGRTAHRVPEPRLALPLFFLRCSCVPPRTNLGFHPPDRAASTPAVHHDGHWWLVTPTGTVPASDPAFTGELDRFAADMAAADRAIANLCTERTALGEDQR